MVVQQEFLKSLPYFTGLDESVLDVLKRYVFEKKAERGEILAFEGERSDILYFVVEGAVKVFKTSADGKEQIFRIIRPGESFNDVPVLGDGINLVSAEAMGPVVLNAIKKSDLEAILHERPQLAMNVIQVLSKRVQELVSLVEDFSFRHVTSRVAKMLLEYVDQVNAEEGITQLDFEVVEPDSAMGTFFILVSLFIISGIIFFLWKKEVIQLGR